MILNDIMKVIIKLREIIKIIKRERERDRQRERQRERERETERLLTLEVVIFSTSRA